MVWDYSKRKSYIKIKNWNFGIISHARFWKHIKTIRWVSSEGGELWVRWGPKGRGSAREQLPQPRLVLLWLPHDETCACPLLSHQRKEGDSPQLPEPQELALPQRGCTQGPDANGKFLWSFEEGVWVDAVPGSFGIWRSIHVEQRWVG